MGHETKGGKAERVDGPWRQTQDWLMNVFSPTLHSPGGDVPYPLLDDVDATTLGNEADDNQILIVFTVTCRCYTAVRLPRPLVGRWLAHQTIMLCLRFPTSPRCQSTSMSNVDVVHRPGRQRQRGQLVPRLTSVQVLMGPHCAPSAFG